MQLLFMHCYSGQVIEYFHLKSINFVNIKSKKFLILTSIILVFITILSGGFMAGSHAGQSFNTYPLMNGKIIPDDIYLAEMGILNLFENTVTINFNHRWIATLTFVYTFSLFLYLFISKITGLQKSIIVLVINLKLAILSWSNGLTIECCYTIRKPTSNKLITITINFIISLFQINN